MHTHTRYVSDYNDGIDGLADQSEDVNKAFENYVRLVLNIVFWPLWVLSILVAAIYVIGGYTRSAWTIKLNTAFAIWVLIFVAALVSGELGVGLVTGDFCQDPDAFTIQIIPEGEADTANYYFDCPATQNPLTEPLDEAREVIDEQVCLPSFPRPPFVLP
jgi:hypothetical protein